MMDKKRMAFIKSYADGGETKKESPVTKVTPKATAISVPYYYQRFNPGSEGKLGSVEYYKMKTPTPLKNGNELKSLSPGAHWGGESVGEEEFMKIAKEAPGQIVYGKGSGALETNKEKPYYTPEEYKTSGYEHTLPKAFGSKNGQDIIPKDIKRNEGVDSSPQDIYTSPKKATIAPLTPPPTLNYKEGGELSPTKAKTMLKDNQANGRPLTDKQKRYFGWVAGGSKAEGGEIEGKGTGKSDSIDAKLEEKSFIVPVEHAKEAMMLRKKYLQAEEKADLKQGDVDVHVSNGEVLFSPEEVKILKSHGVDLNKLAPNSKSPMKMSKRMMFAKSMKK